MSELANKEYREALVEENIRTGLAFQIRALREKHRLSQAQLGEKAGMPQNAVSRLEDPDYGRFTIKTLVRLAAAFDIGLSVKFVSFQTLLDSLEDLRPETLAVPSFREEQEERQHTMERYLGGLAAYSEVTGNVQEKQYPWQHSEPTGASSALVPRGQPQSSPTLESLAA